MCQSPENLYLCIFNTLDIDIPSLMFLAGTSNQNVFMDSGRD